MSDEQNTIAFEGGEFAAWKNKVRHGETDICFCGRTIDSFTYDRYNRRVKILHNDGPSTLLCIFGGKPTDKMKQVYKESNV